ncbi:MAG: cytochrome c maturation protein CcmE [Dehalococcoidia bacterium]|nr:cytochrome c maturation protein CcmE [Dehalococcoidia bacterium]MDW8119767.1 cytochrome c maturation protein CcmE [Chloroflexota bacterium]
MHQVPSPPKGWLRQGGGKLLLVGVLLVASLGYFGWTAFRSSTVYYRTVDELLALGERAYHKDMRVSGKLVAGSFQRVPGSTQAFFVLTDPKGEGRLLATYTGVVPELFFNPYSEIVLEGQLQPNGVFVAEQVIVKCPSKYASQPLGEVPQGN